MNMKPQIIRRAGLALSVSLSACAAGTPGNASGIDGPGAAYGSFLAARYADARQDSGAAAHYYGLALQADPDNPSLVDESFVAAVVAGSPAAPALARQVGGNALAAMLLGNQAAMQGDFAEAATHYGQLPQDPLSGLLKPLLIAWSQAGAGHSDAALAGLTPQADGSPFGAVDILNAALIADAAKDMKDAATLYGAVDNDPAPNLRLAQVLASWKARQGDMNGAQAELDAMVESHPSLGLALPNLQADIARPVISSPTEGLAEAYLAVAGSLDQPSQTLLRVTFLRFALTLRPDLSAARLLLSNVQSAGDGDPKTVVPDTQLAAALATLRPIPAADPLYAPAALQEAQLMAALGQNAQAVALLDDVARHSPGAIDPLETAGDILRSEQDFGQAISYYDRAIGMLPAPPPEAAWSLYYNRAICEDQTGNWITAQGDLRTALSLSPNQPYVLNYLGYTWALKGQHLDQASAMLAQAASLMPNEGAIIDSLGYVSLKKGDTGAAVKLLTRAVEMDPDDAEVNAHLGDAFYAAGLRLQADYQWQRALALQPDSKLHADIEGKLKQFAPPA